MNDAPTEAPRAFDIEVVNQFADKNWRMANLYYILDENNREVKFVPNVMQRRFWDEMWYLNLILKARQHGATTFIDLFILDDCVFIPNQIAGIIAHTIDDVKKIFRRKIKHPYDRLPSEIRDANPASNDSAQELVFGNKSEISVGTTMRAGTLSYLHVSEFGYIAARTPEKADEIVTGSFNTVHPGSFVFVESTGYGKCYDDTTEVLTDTGWKLFADLRESDKIMSMDRTTRVAYYEACWSHVAYHWRGPMIEFKSRSVDLLVTPNHMMWAARQRGPMRLQPATEMLSTVTDYHFDRAFVWDKPGLTEFILPEYEHRQGAGQRVRLKVAMPINVWLRFLGMWLADGHVDWRPGNKGAHLTQVQHQDEFRDAIKAVALALGVAHDERRHGNGVRLSIHSAQLAAYLKAYAKPKRIPRELLDGLSSNQCKTLLEAIYIGDGDGSKGDGKGRIFVGIDREFQDDVQELALKAGYGTRRTGTPRNLSVSFSERQTALLDCGNRPIVRPGYDAMVYCVALPRDHLLMVRRNGPAVWCGNSGHFYDMCQRTKARKLTGVPLSKMDFKYHFYAWWENPKYTLPDDDAKHVVFTRQHNEYFRRIERSEGITLTLGQRAWYIKKKELNGDLQGREYPSNDREPFEVAVRGSIFAEDMMKLREGGRITKVPHDPALMVDTWWDLGRGAKNAIWFVQQLGMEYRLIHYHEEELRSLQYWCGKFLPELAKERGFKYRHHCAPHDIESTDMTSARDKTRWQIASELGVTFIPGKQWDQGDQIEAGHSLLPLCWIDEENCSEGITHLELFRFEWNENLQTYMDARYRHDAHSHGCSALMTGAMLQGDLHTQRPRAQPVGRRSFPT